MRVRAALAFSLFVIAATAFGGPFGDLKRKIDAAPPNMTRQLVQASPLAKDPRLASIIDDDGPDTDKQLRSAVTMLAEFEDGGKAQPGAQNRVQAIKRDPAFHDSGIEQANWLGQALDRLRGIHAPKIKSPDGPNLGFLAFLAVYVPTILLSLLVVIVLLLLFLGLRYITWQRRLKRTATALMEDDEPARTLDEWLAQADALEAQGRFREAVRALYLASLLRFDEARIARFDRNQTNWEHLRRIEASALLPSSIDFRPPTQLFDRVWYGHLLCRREDVEAMRQTYVGLTQLLTQRVAA